jgi:hypothetical protein
MKATRAQLSRKFVFSIFIEVVDRIVAMAVSPRGRRDKEHAIRRENAAYFRQRTARISEVLDHIK